MLVEFGKANLIDKARQQPDKVKQVLDKLKTDGVLPTLEAVFNKLGQSIPLGYCNAGKVVAVGKGLTEFKVATDSCLRAKLVENGKKQLLKYDTYEQRTEKLIGIAESLVRSKKTRTGKTSRGGGRPIIED